MVSYGVAVKGARTKIPKMLSGASLLIAPKGNLYALPNMHRQNTFLYEQFLSESDGRFDAVYKMSSPIIPKRERFVTRFDHLYPEFEVSFDFKILDSGPVNWRSLFRLSTNSIQSDRDRL